MVSTGDLFGADPKQRTPRGAIPRWADRYGYSIRLIKKWLAIGREAGDLPPMDEPEKLPVWYERHLGKAPPRLIEAVERLGGKVEAREALPAGPVFEVPEVRDDELGIEQQLENFRREVVMLQKLRRQALEKEEFTKASGYLDQLNKVSSEIRQLEKLLPTLMRERGDLKSTDEVRRETVNALKVLRAALVSQGRKARSRLVAIRDEEHADRIWMEEVENAFREASEAGFQEVLTLEA